MYFLRLLLPDNIMDNVVAQRQRARGERRDIFDFCGHDVEHTHYFRADVCR